MSSTFDKDLTCTNCEETHTYRFRRGTELHGKFVLCHTCGCKVAATATAPAVVSDSLDKVLSFARDFFSLKP